MHLILDGYGANREKLADAETVTQFLLDLPEKMAMKPISAVQVCQYQGNLPDQNGVSGFVMIAESHISIHTWPEHRVLWADVFSCRSFNVDAIIEALVFTFGVKNYERQVLERALQTKVAT